MYLEMIEQAISNLDAGPFQNLSRALISKKYPNYSCQANGSMIGSVKTTKSHPDCLFINNNNNSFILVECTTQQNGLGKKLNDDITDCLDELRTKIPVASIEKIIFCYSNGKIANNVIYEQKERLLSYNLKLELMSVNDMALDINHNYPELASEYLGINLFKTLNILSVEDFINETHNGLSPSLDKIFSSRDSEIAELEKAIESNNLIVLYGKSGVGKSKLAIEVLKRISKDERRIKCIKARGIFDYSDLFKTISNTDYYLIDDADKFSDIGTIVNYLKGKKVVFTIRDYELSKFNSKFNDFDISYFGYEVKSFTDEALNKIINDNIGPCNNSFLNKLDEIVMGNIRLAFMVAETCKKNNNLSALYDSRDIFGKYYENRINTILSEEKTFAVFNCIALIIFNKHIKISRLDDIIDLLSFFQIAKNDFFDIVKYLEKEEIVSIYENEIIEMSDQCLSNYLGYYIYFKKKIISLKDMISSLFPLYKNNIIALLNQTLNVFFNNEDLEYIRNDVRESWNIFDGNIEILKELSGSFSSLNPIPSLKLLYDTIDNNKKDDEWIINTFNSTLKIETDISVRLFKQYIEKGVISPEKAEKILLDGFMIDENDCARKYEIQKTIINELSHDFPVFNKRLSNYCLKLLQFDFEKNSMRGNKFLISRMNIGNGDINLYNLREKCINYLAAKNDIFSILKTYFSYCPQDNNLQLFENDLKIFNKEIESVSKNELLEAGIYFYSKHIFDFYKLKWNFLYLRNKEIIEFLEPVLKEPNDRSIPYHERKTKYENRLIKNIKASSKLSIERVSVLIQLNGVFDELKSQINDYFEFCINYIDQDYVYELFDILDKSKWLENNKNLINYFVHRYKTLFGVEKAFEIIKNELPNYCKGRAFEALFTSLADVEIDEKTFNLFDEYLLNIDNYPLTFFVPQHWFKVCGSNSKFLLLCKKVLEFGKKGYGQYLLYMIFERDIKENLFGILFALDRRFVEEVYLYSLTIENDYFDDDGTYLVKLVKNNMDFLGDFIELLFNSRHDTYIKKRICALWASDEFMKYGDLMFSKLIEQEKKYLIEFYGVTIMGDVESDSNKMITNNQLMWFEHCLCINRDNIDSICCLFDCVKDFNYDSKIECLKVLLKYSNSFEIFKSISLNPTSFSFTGSQVPLIQHKIAFYEKIKEIIPSQIEFIDHLNYVDEILLQLKKSIKNVLISEREKSNRYNW